MSGQELARARQVLECRYQRRARAHILVVVGDEQATAAVGALAQHVQLDHVHAVAQGGVKARERVPRLDMRGSLVADAPRAS
jgi:hypothetical protein